MLEMFVILGFVLFSLLKSFMLCIQKSVIYSFCVYALSLPVMQSADASFQRFIIYLGNMLFSFMICYFLVLLFSHKICFI